MIEHDTIRVVLEAPVIRECDVLVAGGGPAGVTAAVAAARQGARVVLLERLAALGGNLTAGLVNPMLTFHARSGLQIVRGLAQEIIDRLIDAGGSPGHIPDPVAFVKTITPFQPDVFKHVLDRFVLDAGVEVFFHSQVVDVRKVDQRITHVVALAGKQGPVAFAPRVVIDATGDGDVSAFAGEMWTFGRKEDGQAQPMTMMFRMAGVDTEQIRSYVQQHPDQFHKRGAGIDPSSPYLGVAGYFDAVKQAIERGELPPLRDRILFFTGVDPGEVIVNVTRVLGASVMDAKSWSNAETEGRRQVWQYARFLQRYIPGFERSRVIHVGQQLGIRESRLIAGRYVLQADDLMNGVPFPDRVAAGSYPVDIHSPSDSRLQTRELKADYYFIPYRSMLPRYTQNLIVAGRCISATHEACAAIRVSPIAMAIGEAAGVAAGIAHRLSISPADVDPGLIQAEVDLPPALHQ